MARIEQLPPNLDLRLIAGRQFVLSVTCTGATVGSPTVTIKTAAGDAYTTDPGVPTVSVAAGVITVGFSAADTAALNGTTRPRSYQWALSATLDGAGPFDLLAGIISAMPIGSSGQSSASSATLTFTAGVTAVALAVTVGGGGGGGGASALDDLTDVAITSPSSGQVLKYNGTAWINDADATGGGGSLVVQEGDVTVVSAASTLDFGAGFDVTESPAGEANIALDLTEYAGGALPVTGGGTGSTSASAARTALGLVIGTDVQAQDAELSAIAGLTSAADRLPYFTGSGTAALATFTAAGRALVDDADATAQRSTLGLGGAATLNVGTTASTVAAGDDSRIVGAVQTTRTISTTAPLSGGGDLSTNRTLSVASASDTAQGVVELATTAETTTGTDATRAVTPAGLLNATTASNINARVAVENNGTLVGTRRTLNFIQGSNVTLTIADDPANEEVDVTIAAAGGGGGSVFGFPYTFDPAPHTTGPVNGNEPAGNWCTFARVMEGGSNIGKIALFVTQQAGFISVAVYSNTGSGRSAAPGTRLATSGSVAAPAVGYAEVALGSATTVAAGDWFAVSASFDTFVLRLAGGPATNTTPNGNLVQGRIAFMSSGGHPAPASNPTVTVGGKNVILIGVP